MILSGGAGTRLWPLSTRAHPKQFLDLLDEPLFEATLRRVAALPSSGPVIVVTGADHLPNVEQALAATSTEVASIVVEPQGRNTAPAVIAAALAAGPDDVLLVLPSDHLIADTDAFAAAVEQAVVLSRKGALVTFGVGPTRAETGYGYIEKGRALEGGFEVARFKEKPDDEEARRLFADAAHLWNSGMFVFTVTRILEEARRHVPQIVTVVADSFPDDTEGTIWLADRFAGATAISVDHAIMEKARKAAVVPLDAGWSDIGSWQSVWEQSERDLSGNVFSGEVVAVEVTGSYVRAGSRSIAVAGVEDLIVVETPEVVLIVPREKAQLVRDLATTNPLPRENEERGKGQRSD